jgi:hypothetical protein
MVKSNVMPPPSATVRPRRGTFFVLAAALVVLESIVGASLITRTRIPTAAAPKAITPLFSMFDGVSLYQKNGLVEIYGAELRLEASGPIRISRSAVHVADDRAYVFWSPDYSPVKGATHVEVFVNPPVKRGSLTVGILTAAGKTYLFRANPGPPAPSPLPAPLPPLVPDEWKQAIANPAAVVALEAGAGGALVGSLPPALLNDLIADPTGAKAIRSVFVVIDNAAGEIWQFERLGVAMASADTRRQTTTALAGQVIGATRAPGESIRLLTERGAVIEQQLALDGTFRFEKVPVGVPVSLRVAKDRQEHYATLGRWFMTGEPREDLVVDLAPLFVNADGHAPDASKARFITPRQPSTVSAFYESHARQIWPGNTTPQEYDSTTFTNNMGFLDRDRFFDNPGRCFRVVHLGSSHAVALQVRPFEKYNIEMESELAVRLQRCVEVISAGRDNGDIGSNYPRVRDYAIRFSPDIILLENSSSLIAQLHPELLRRGFGWDHEFNALDNFFYDPAGVLRFRPWSAEYPVHATKPDFPEYLPGVAFTRTLQLPFEVMPAIGKEAYRYLADIMAYFKGAHPEQNFVIHTGLDQAQCRDRCDATITLPSGVQVPVGATTFAATHREFCERHGLRCVAPADTRGYGTPATYLNFINDGHYSVRGHQWLARELSGAIANLPPAINRR